MRKFVKFMYDQQNLKSWVSDAGQLLSVDPAQVSGAKSSNALVNKGVALTKDAVDYLLLPDSYIPAGYDYQPVATEFLGHKGETSAEFCKALDGLYTS